MKTKSNFSLIELLVAVGIIAVLLSITLPALKRAKSLSYRVSCMSNLKQLGARYSLYTTEYNGYWPPYDETVVNSTQSVLWKGKYKWPWLVFLGKIGKGKKKGWWKSIEIVTTETSETNNVGFSSMGNIYQCPADENPTLVNFADLDGETAIDGYNMSYAYNLMLYSVGIPVPRMDLPGRTILNFDADVMVQMQGEWASNPDYYAEVLAERHQNGANHLFADYHVEWKPIVTTANIIPQNR